MFKIWQRDHNIPNDVDNRLSPKLLNKLVKIENGNRFYRELYNLPCLVKDFIYFHFYFYPEKIKKKIESKFKCHKPNLQALMKSDSSATFEKSFCTEIISKELTILRK